MRIDVSNNRPRNTTILLCTLEHTQAQQKRRGGQGIHICTTQREGALSIAIQACASDYTYVIKQLHFLIFDSAHKNGTKITLLSLVLSILTHTDHTLEYYRYTLIKRKEGRETTSYKGKKTDELMALLMMMVGICILLNSQRQ